MGDEAAYPGLVTLSRGKGWDVRPPVVTARAGRRRQGTCSRGNRNHSCRTRPDNMSGCPVCLCGGFLGPGTFGAKTRPVLSKLAQAGQQTPSPDPKPRSPTRSLAGQPKTGTPLSAPSSEGCPNPLQASGRALASEFISPITGEFISPIAGEREGSHSRGGLRQGLGQGTGWGARPSRKGPGEPGQGWQCRKRDPLPEGTGASAGHGPGGAAGGERGEGRHLDQGLQPPTGREALPAGCPCQPTHRQEARGTGKSHILGH